MPINFVYLGEINHFWILFGIKCFIDLYFFCMQLHPMYFIKELRQFV